MEIAARVLGLACNWDGRRTVVLPGAHVLFAPEDVFVFSRKKPTSCFNTVFSGLLDLPVLATSLIHTYIIFQQL